MVEPERIVEAVYVGTSLALSGMFYYLYRRQRRTVDKLNDAPLLTLDGRLLEVVSGSPGKCLRYVALEGTVQPVGPPLTSQLKEGTVGVVQRVGVKELSVAWSSLAQTWLRHEQTLHESVTAVPFSLLGSDRATAVRVLCPLDASRLDTVFVYRRFHPPAPRSLVSDVLATALTWTRPKGQLETEHMLKVGATLTGVGELVLGADRALKLRPPADGSPYFLTSLDIDALRMQQEVKALALKLLASAFALAAAAVLLWVGRRHYGALRERWERQRLRREFERQEEQGAASSDSDCVICLSRPRGCVLLDCGHVCCCFSCYQALPLPASCPICRRDIKRVVPLYQA